MGATSVPSTAKRPQDHLPPKWRSLEESAEYLRVTQRTVRHYIAEGRLPASRISGSRLIRIRQDDLDALLRPIPSGKSDGAA